MKVLVQKCVSGSVKIDNEIYNSIQKGYVVFVGFTKGDDLKTIEYLAKKVVNLRIFEDEQGIMNRSILEEKGEILSISQFTLYADTTHGNRPSYIKSLNRESATVLYDLWNKELEKYLPTKAGVFGSDMIISIENDGPTTILLEKEEQ